MLGLRLGLELGSVDLGGVGLPVAAQVDRRPLAVDELLLDLGRVVGERLGERCEVVVVLGECLRPVARDVEGRAAVVDLPK